MTVQDLASNAMVVGPGATEGMIGFEEPTPSQEILPLDMYSFLIKTVRTSDLNDGALFVKRFLDGPQTLWRQIQEDIFSVRDLWDVTRIENRFLKFLKNIVGWTPELEAPITDRLTDDELRKLIAVSVPLWKIRGTEPGYASFLLTLINARFRIWNWFDYRWILDETQLGEDHQGRDPFLVGSDEENLSEVRIVDNGDLDKVLVVNMLKLFRPSGERVTVRYLSFLDLFGVDGDDIQWTVTATETETVANAVMSFADDTSVESAEVDASAIEDAADWTDYVAYWRWRAPTNPTSGTIELHFFKLDDDDLYIASFDIDANTMTLTTEVAGAPSGPAAVDMGAFGVLLDVGVYYGTRIHVENVLLPSAGTRVRVYLDNEEILDYLFTTASRQTSGIIGMKHSIGATLDVDEVEMFELPMDFDAIELNDNL